MTLRPERYDELVSRYLDEDMNQVERLDFEAACRLDPALMSRLNLVQESLSLLRQAHPRKAPPLALTLRAMDLAAPRAGTRLSGMVPLALARTTVLHRLREVRGHARNTMRKVSRRYRRSITLPRR